MKRLIKKIVATVVNSWNEANVLISKSYTYSI